MAYFWVNQKKTFKEEFAGGYMWSPKFMSGNRTYWSYEFMKEVNPGDIVFAYANGAIKAVGHATSSAYSAQKPSEFGMTGDYWDAEGWRVDVAFEPVIPFKPKDFLADIRPLLPEKYSPLQHNGNGNQIYLTKLSNPLGEFLIRVLQPQAREGDEEQLPNRAEVHQKILSIPDLANIYEKLATELDDSAAAWMPSQRRKIDSAVLWYGLPLPNGKSSYAFGLKVTGEIIFHFGMMKKDSRRPFNEEEKRRNYCQLFENIPGMIFEPQDWNREEKTFPVNMILPDIPRAQFVKAIDWFCTEVLTHYSNLGKQRPIIELQQALVGPPLEGNIPELRRQFIPTKVDWHDRFQKSMAIGNQGEDWVVQFEKQRLIDLNRTDLAARVERVSQTLGDGLGYDVLSFNNDGSERHIEVKAAWGDDSSFEISATELEYSKYKPESFYLYRVFNLRDQARVYILRGDLSANFRLIPHSYRAYR